MGKENAVSVVVVFDDKHNVLSLKRGPTDSYRPGSWNFPGGYNDSSDANPRAAAIRELREETGLVVKPKDLQRAFVVTIEGRRTHVYWVKFSRRPRVVLQDGEHSEYRWTPLDRVPRPMIPSVGVVQKQMQVEAARENPMPETWAFLAAGILPMVLMPMFMNEYRKDLSAPSRLARGVLLGAGWSLYGMASLFSGYMSTLPVINYIVPAGPALVALQFGGLPLVGYATYKLVKKPSTEVTGPL